MEALSFIDTIIQDWEIIVVAFAIGGAYYEAKRSFKKIMTGLENTSNTHAAQNIILDNINDKVDALDKRLSKIEGSVDMLNITNHEQSIKLAVLETQQDLDKPIRKRRQSVQ